MSIDNLTKHPLTTLLGIIVSAVLIAAVLYFKPDNEIALTVLGFLPAIWGSLMKDKKEY